MWKRPQTIFGAIWSLLLLLREAIGLWGDWEFISEKVEHIWGVRQVIDFLVAPPPWFVFGSILSIIALFVWAYKAKNNAPKEAIKPKLKIVFEKGIEPYEHTEPANATDKAFRLYRIKVLNEGNSRLNTCVVKLVEISKITNVHIPAVLKQRNDNPPPPPVNRRGEVAQYKQTFSLNAHDEDFIDVAFLDETNPASEIMLCYAKSPAEAYPGIPRDRYVLKLRAFAEIGEFSEAAFSLYVENGILHFERLS